VSGTQTPDRYPGIRQEEEIEFFETTEAPTTPGAMKYVNGQWMMIDGVGTFNPRTGGASIGIENLILTTEGGIIYSSAGVLIVKAAA
jgi:hypothetical protein